MFLAVITLDFIAKLLVIAVFTPMWLPIVKELWNEVNESMVEDGGLLGKKVDEQEVERVMRDRQQRGASLVSQPQGEAKGGRAGRASGGGPSRGRGSGAPKPKRRGF